MTRILRHHRGLSFLLALLLLATTGCYGSFPLTHDVYAWNGKTGSKWANEVVFVVFVIVPIYGVTLLVDALVLNSIEFWSDPKATTKSQSPEPSPPGDAALLEAYRDVTAVSVFGAPTVGP